MFTDADTTLRILQHLDGVLVRELGTTEITPIVSSPLSRRWIEACMFKSTDSSHEEVDTSVVSTVRFHKMRIHGMLYAKSRLVCRHWESMLPITHVTLGTWSEICTVYEFPNSVSAKRLRQWDRMTSVSRPPGMCNRHFVQDLDYANHTPVFPVTTQYIYMEMTHLGKHFKFPPNLKHLTMFCCLSRSCVDLPDGIETLTVVTFDSDYCSGGEMIKVATCHGMEFPDTLVKTGDISRGEWIDIIEGDTGGENICGGHPFLSSPPRSSKGGYSVVVGDYFDYSTVQDVEDISLSMKVDLDFDISGMCHSPDKHDAHQLSMKSLQTFDSSDWKPRFHGITKKNLVADRDAKIYDEWRLDYVMEYSKKINAGRADHGSNCLIPKKKPASLKRLDLRLIRFADCIPINFANSNI